MAVPVPHRVAEAVCGSLPKMLRQEGIVDNNCILSTRLIVDACHHAGLRAGAVACQVVAVSPALAHHIDSGGPCNDAAPGWSVGIGYRNRPWEQSGNGYNGHLITNLSVGSKGNIVVDTSIGQVARPKRDLEVGPMWTEVTEEFLSGVDTMRFTRPNGTVLFYDAQPEREDYLSAPDWTQTLKRDPKLVNRVRRLVADACR